ncbi:hypothetical protein GCM10022397_43830 [Flavivirga jejuensis]
MVVGTLKLIGNITVTLIYLKNLLIIKKMFLQRPSNKYLDFDTIISLSKPTLLIPDNCLIDGRWNI